MFHKILNANDGSEHAFKALDAAIEIARRFEAELHVILVEEVPFRPAMIEEVRAQKAHEDRLLRQRLKRIEDAAARRETVARTHVFVGHPVERIVDFARGNGFDLLVIGSSEHADFLETLLGSRDDRIAHRAPCAVLIVK